MDNWAEADACIYNFIVHKRGYDYDALNKTVDRSNRVHWTFKGYVIVSPSNCHTLCYDHGGSYFDERSRKTVSFSGDVWLLDKNGSPMCNEKLTSIDVLKTYLEKHFPAKPATMAEMWTTMNRLVDILEKHTNT